MNRRISPDDLNYTPYRELISGLTLEWMRAELPANGLTYADFLTDIKTLLLTIQNSERSTVIVQAIIIQAIALHKTSAWVEQELKFEGMIEGADRSDFLLLDLQQSNSIDDTILDSYNERLNRFISKTMKA